LEIVGKTPFLGQKTRLPEKQKSLETIEFQGFFMELLGRFELPTSSLPIQKACFWGVLTHPDLSVLDRKVIKSGIFGDFQNSIHPCLSLLIC